MDAVDTLHEILKTGAEPYPYGDKLRIKPGHMPLPADLDPHIRNNKDAILALLHDPDILLPNLETGAHVTWELEQSGRTGTDKHERYERLESVFSTLWLLKWDREKKGVAA